MLCGCVSITDVRAVSRCVWSHAWEHKLVISVCCCIKPYGWAGMASVLYYYQFTFHMLQWLSWDACVFAHVSYYLCCMYYYMDPWSAAAAYVYMTVQACDFLLVHLPWTFWSCVHVSVCLKEMHSQKPVLMYLVFKTCLFNQNCQIP